MPLARDVAKSNSHSPVGELVLAVDTGGTKTAAWIVELAGPGDYRCLGQARTSAGNPLSVGFEKSTQAIAEAFNQARHSANLPNHPVARAILSIAGAANGDMTNRFIGWARSVGLAERIAIVSDVLPILAAGAPDCCGIALIAGTGSVAFGRASSGQSVRCGGWGFLLGDEGSGYDIGRDALQLALLCLDSNGQRSPLVETILSTLQVDSATALTRSIYNSADSRHAIAALAPLVAQAAENNDADACRILDDAATHLADLVDRAAHAIGFAHGKFSLAVSGGLLTSSKPLQDQLRAKLEQHSLNCAINVVTEPLEGCVRLTDPNCAGDLVTWHAT